MDPDRLDRLHRRLAAAAEAEGLLDVAYRTVDSPVGTLLLAATDTGLVRVAYANEDHDRVLQTLSDRISPRILRASGPPRRRRPRARRVLRRSPARLHAARSTGDCRPASARPCCSTSPTSTTATPPATRRSPSSPAPKAVRAVGTACATNPLPVVVPCHRVVKSDGSMGGYLGGADAKATLLELEAAA